MANWKAYIHINEQGANIERSIDIAVKSYIWSTLNSIKWM